MTEGPGCAVSTEERPESDTYRTDAITVALLSAIPAADLAAMCSELTSGTAFMTEFGPYDSTDPEIAHLKFHAWARRRLIADVTFASGTRYVDGSMSLRRRDEAGAATVRQELPASIRGALAGQPVRDHAPHRCFEGVAFADSQRDDDASTLAVNAPSVYELGKYPGATLAEVARRCAERAARR